MPNRWQLRLLNLSFVVLLLAVAGLVLWLSRTYHVRLDLTQSSRHSLSDASVAVLARLPEPLKVTAFASQRGELRTALRDFLAKYQKHKPDITLEFVDPDSQPERVRAAGVQFDGELLLEHGEARETLAPTKLNEENFTNALTRLGRISISRTGPRISPSAASRPGRSPSATIRRSRRTLRCW